jgi:hypothetical protein
MVMPKGIGGVERGMPEILEDAESGLLGHSRELFARLYAHFRELDRQVGELERQIKAWHRGNTASRRLEAMPGIGPLSASALAARFDQASTSVFHQGPRPSAVNRGRMYGCNLYLGTGTEKRLGIKGRPCMNLRDGSRSYEPLYSWQVAG